MHTKTHPELGPFRVLALGHERVSSESPVAVRVREAKPMAASLFDIHQFCELGVVLKGCYRRISSEFEAEVKSGQMWVCGP